MDLIYLYPSLNDSPAKVGRHILEHLAKNKNSLPFEDIKLFNMGKEINVNKDFFKKFEVLNLNDIIRYRKDYLVHIPISPNVFPNRKFLLNLLCLIKKKPFVINYHGDIRKHIVTKFKYEKRIDLLSIPSAIFMPYLLKTATVVVTHSYILDIAIRNNYGLKNSIVIPNGIDDYWFKPLKDNNFDKIDKNKLNIFFHGRLSSEKGVDFLINAVGIYVKIKPDIMLYIAGEGPQKKYLEHLCKEQNIVSNVVFLGNVDKETIKLFLKNVNVAIYPSRFDNFPLSIMESLACAECPIYYSEEAGLCDFVIKDGYNLNQFKPSVENIICILKSTSNNEGIVSSQRDFAKKYTWDRIVNEYIKLYANVTKEFCNSK